MTDRFNDIAKNILSEGLDEHAKFDALKEKYGVMSLKQFSEQYLSVFVAEAVEATSEDFVRREMIREGVRSHMGDNMKGGRPMMDEEPIEEMKKGALHKDLGVPQGEHIPTSKIRAAKAKAEREGDKTEIKRTTFALNTREEKEIKEDDGEVDEEITSKTPAGSVIKDFVHSKNKMFKGDSKKERIKRALGAYYKMHEETCTCEECRYMKENAVNEEGHEKGCKCSACKKLMREETKAKIEEARSAECKCTSNFTCGHCLANAKPYHFTPSTSAEIMARQQEKDKPKNVKEETEEHAHQNRARKAIRKVLTAKKALEDGDDDSKKKLEEVLVLKNTHTHGDKMAKIYWDRDWHEHRVKLFHGGVHQKEADYHTPDRDDAEGTAHVMIGKPHPDSPVNESIKGERREQGINRAANRLAKEEIEGSLRDVVSDADKERKFGLTHAQYELSPHDVLDDAGKLVPADKDPIADVTVKGVQLRGVPKNPGLHEASNHAPTLHYFQNEENAKPKGSFMEVTSTGLSEWAKRKGIYNKVTEATKKMTRKEDVADSSNAGKRDDNEEPLVRASQKGPDKINLKPTMPDGLTNPDGASPVRSGLSEKRKR